MPTRTAWKMAYQIDMPDSWVEELGLQRAIFNALDDMGKLYDEGGPTEPVMLIVEVLPLISKDSD